VYIYAERRNAEIVVGAPSAFMIELNLPVKSVVEVRLGLFLYSSSYRYAFIKDNEELVRTVKEGVVK
jgi:hypothetical protein